MSDAIIIQKLELSAHIGIGEEERETAQRLTASLVLEPIRGCSGLADELANSVDYLVVSRAVQVLARVRPRRLLETLAEEIATELLARFPLTAVGIELRKYILPDTEFVAVRMRRERAPSA